MSNAASPSDPRPLGAAFAACALATLGLLANHPASSAHDFAGVLQEEAAHRLADAIVHGGFVFVLAALVICFALLGRRLGAGRVPVVITVVTVGIGCAALMASMVVDGLVIPAVAARYVGITTPEALAAAKSLFVFAGALIGFLMPLGVAFQGIGMLSLGTLLLTHERSRVAGALATAIAVLILALLLIAPARLGTHVLLASLAVLALWHLALGLMLWRGRLAP